MRRLALLAVVACGSKAVPPARLVEPPPVATAPEPRQVAAEQVIALPWAASITVPAAWWIVETAELVTLQDPERELTIGLAALKAASRDEALRAAWKRVRPEADLQVAQQIDVPPREGWDEIAQVVYVTKTEESRLVAALARRTKDTWHVATIDGKVAALDRRGAQLASIIEDMKVRGVDRESFAGKPARLDAEHLAKLDAAIEELRVLAKVPGVAVGVVHGGKLVLEKGYGVRSVKGKQPVTPQTLFMIGSTTKSLTTLMLARLVEAKRLEWTTPVAQVLPEFKLADAATTAKVLLQHTACACTGMPRRDFEFLFEYDGWDPEQRLASMATMRPTTGFGETFQYSNLMVAAGGWAGARIHAPKQKLGPAYDDAMKQLVFAPLGMTATTFDTKLATRGDHARSHGRALTLDYEEISLDYERAVYAVRPAGAAWSNVRDLARYMLLELGNGTLDGKPVIGEAALLERRAPRVKIDADNAYGLGLFVSLDHGVEVVHHGGNMLGFTSDLFVLPKHDLGVVVLTNAGAANAFRGAVRRAVMEIVFDGRPEAKENLTLALERLQKTNAEEGALMIPDATWLGGLAGTYQNADLGKLVIKRAGNVATLDVGEWKSVVERKVDRDATQKLRTMQPPYDGLELVPRIEGGKQVLVLEAGQYVYKFTRVD